MWSLTCMTGLLCLIWINALAFDEIPSKSLIQKTSYSREQEIVFDEQPIKNNSLVHAACRVHMLREHMNCTLVLKSFPDAKAIDESSCEVSYRAGKGRQISTEFQLKRLFGDYVAFVWTDEEKLHSDQPRKHLVLSVVDMKGCESTDYHFDTPMEDFHVVVYDDIFDVYYHNKSQCGEFMCGESFDSKARVLNGPATSYLPSEYFYGNTQMCSVQSSSSAKGHYLITPTDFHVVYADYGQKQQMGPVPFDAQVAMHDCDKELLGYCWLTNAKTILQCQQYNPDGKQIFSTGVNLHDQTGTWMAMKNLGPSQLLLLVNNCKDIDTCAQNTKDVVFRVLKVNPKGETDDVYTFRGLECDNARDVRSEVVQREDGQICLTVACYTRNEENNKSVNLLSNCFRR